MSAKRKVLFTAAALLLGLSLLGCLLAAVYLSIPAYVESRLLPGMESLVGQGRAAFRVRRIQAHGSDLGPIVIGDPARPALTAESVHIDYTPAQIVRGRIQQVVVSGVELFVAYEDGVFTLPGVDVQRILQKLRSPDGAKAPAPVVPVALSIGEVRLHSAVVVGSVGGKTFRIPVAARLVPENGRLDRLDVRLSFFPRDGEVHVQGRLDLGARTATVSAEARLPDLALLSDLAPGAALTGRVHAKVAADLFLDPPAVGRLAGTVSVYRATVGAGGYSLVAAEAEGMEPVLHLTVEGGRDRYTWSLSAVRLNGPVPVVLEGLGGQVRVGRGAVEGSGAFTLKVEPFTATHPVALTLTEPAVFPGRFTVFHTAPDRWGFTLSHVRDDKTAPAPANRVVRLTLNGRPVFWGPPGGVDVSGAGTGNAGQMDLRLDVPGIRLGEKEMEAAADRLILDARSHFPAGSGFRVPAVDVTVTAANLRVAAGPVRLTVPELVVGGRLDPVPGGVPRLNGSIVFADAGLTASAPAVRMEGVQCKVPFQWPPESDSQKGSVSVRRILWENRPVGSAASMVQLKGMNLDFSGTHTSTLLPGLKLAFSGGGSPTPANGFRFAADWRVDGYRPEPDLDLGVLAPGAKGLRLAGTLDAGGRLRVDRSGVALAVNAALRQGRLSDPDRGLDITGVDLSVSLPDALSLRTEPAQPFRFEGAKLGSITIGEGRATFQIEPPGALFVEQGSFQWCGGRVDTGAVRIKPGADAHAMVLYGDRLLLAQVLAQFGVVQAEGGGTLSGKLPVRYEKGRLIFDDGFLYSSPGEGGTLRVLGAESLTAGLEPGTPQHTQLELAREALKDYTYSWVKLGFNTQGETFLLRMQMDGKPAKPLPFTYDRKLGEFIRAPDGGQGSVFQGINLDVNFRLPLDRLLLYQDIFRNLQ